eukprot:CAMPEP_0172497630 /NCGR_PEP_ID=MMETSP1066-20121228/102539_1 /TAXON_ID=671091 /ORGANISM="Coscinodiscus wailesii, Strain CCMP2513" /LENGTH=348 /DNA_ID=CAMNT_0013270503 /DNA_START=59 /DNA_END=1105 /DNA_ORIENTATION=+
MNYRTYDAFAKPIEGLRTHTASGGLITIIGGAFSILLFLSQVYLYLQVDTRHSFHLAESIRNNLPHYHNAAASARRSHKNQFPISVHVTFPHLSCQSLDLALDDARTNELNTLKDNRGSGLHAIVKSIPNRKDFVGTPFTWDARKAMEGCTVRGKLLVPMVGGTLALTISSKAWHDAVNKINPGMMMMRMLQTGGLPLTDMMIPKTFNVSHYVHELSFGTPFPLTPDPLAKSTFAFAADSGVGLNNVNVKIIPTKYKRFARSAKDTHQVSVIQHMVETQTLAAQGATVYPGLLVSYDFSPLQVHHTERRENFFLFLSGLVSIVGGVFVVVGFVGSVLVNAADLAKKKD